MIADHDAGNFFRVALHAVGTHPAQGGSFLERDVEDLSGELVGDQGAAVRGKSLVKSLGQFGVVDPPGKGAGEILE